MGFSGCCGQPASRKRRSIEREALPDNPKPSRGVRLVYIGSGKKEIIGPSSGLVYTVADWRRHFVVDPGDVHGILRLRGFMLEP